MSPNWSHSFRFSVHIFVKHLSLSHSCLCPIHITLLELIPFLHKIPNYCNMKNHVNSPDWLWKLTQASNKMFNFVGYENWQDDNKACLLLKLQFIIIAYSKWLSGASSIPYRSTTVLSSTVKNEESLLSLSLSLKCTELTLL
jgi:hypothetical protein